MFIQRLKVCAELQRRLSLKLKELKNELNFMNKKKSLLGSKKLFKLVYVLNIALFNILR